MIKISKIFLLVNLVSSSSDFDAVSQEANTIVKSFIAPRWESNRRIPTVKGYIVVGFSRSTLFRIYIKAPVNVVTIWSHLINSLTMWFAKIRCTKSFFSVKLRIELIIKSFCIKVDGVRRLSGPSTSAGSQILAWVNLINSIKGLYGWVMYGLQFVQYSIERSSRHD